MPGHGSVAPRAQARADLLGIVGNDRGARYLEPPLTAPRPSYATWREDVHYMLVA